MVAMTSKPTRLDRWRESRVKTITGEILAFLGFALARFYRLNGTHAAGALTFTTLLALVPLLAIAFAIFAAFPAFQDVRALVEEAIFENMIPEVGGAVRDQLTRFMANTSKLGGVGVMALGISALMLLSTIEATFNRVWRVERKRPLLQRFLIFWMILTLGPLLIGATISLTSGLAVAMRDAVSIAGLDAEALTPRNQILNQMIALALQAVGFTLLYMLVPNKRVYWRDGLIGGAAAAFFFESLKTGFSLYFANVQTYQTIYGAMAAVPIFLIWLYLSWIVILVGAVLASSFPEWWRSRDLSVDREMGRERVLDAALQILGAIRSAQQAGQPASMTLIRNTPDPEASDVAFAKLDSVGFLVTTIDDRLAFGRDLHTVSLYGLYADLGFAVAAGDDLAAQAVSPALRRPLGDLATAERQSLATNLAEILDALS
jgi:membrane protein